MNYSIKRLREEGHFRLNNLDDVESLDVFWMEANKVKRLYIEEHVAPSTAKISKEDFVGLKCCRDSDYSKELGVCWQT